MYIIFVFQMTAGGSNLLVCLDCFNTCSDFDELGAAYGVYLIDLVQTACITDAAWTTLCEGWRNPSALMITNWSFYMTPIVSGLSKCCAVLDLIFLTQRITFPPGPRVPVSGWVQIFFAWRVWALGRSHFWTAVTALIVAVRAHVHPAHYCPGIC